MVSRSAAALMVWALSAALYAAYFQAQWAYGQRPIFSVTGDEPHYLTIATSLNSDGDLDVLDDYRDKEYFPFYPYHLGDARDMEDMHAIYGRAGGVFSKHSVGLPLLLAPALRVGGHGAATLLMISLTAALSAQVWFLAQDAVRFLGQQNGAEARWGAWLGWAAVALSPPLLLYAPLFYPEVVGGLLTVTATRGTLALSLRPSWRAALVVGVACGLLVWFHLRYAPIAGALGLTASAAAYRWRSQTRALTGVLSALTVPAALLGALLVVVSWRLFGGVPTVDEYGAVAVSRVAIGAPGLVFDRQFGLLPYAPVYALAPLGLLASWRAENRWVLGAIALPCVVYAGFVACFSYWYGAFSPPARMLVPVLPLLVAPLAAAFAHWPAARAAGVVLLLATAAISKLLVDVPRLRYNLPNGTSAALEYLSQLWGRDVTQWLPSFIVPDAGSYLWSSTASLVILLLSFGVTRTRLRVRPR